MVTSKDLAKQDQRGWGGKKPTGVFFHHTETEERRSFRACRGKEQITLKGTGTALESGFLIVVKKCLPTIEGTLNLNISIQPIFYLHVRTMGRLGGSVT